MKTLSYFSQFTKSCHSVVSCQKRKNSLKICEFGLEMKQNTKYFSVHFTKRLTSLDHSYNKSQRDALFLKFIL